MLKASTGCRLYFCARAKLTSLDNKMLVLMRTFMHVMNELMIRFKQNKI